jgi:hypothetical protein
MYSIRFFHKAFMIIFQKERWYQPLDPGTVSLGAAGTTTVF